MVNIYELELTNLQQRIMRLMYIKAGQKLNQHRIAKILGVSQPAVKKSLPELQEKSFIRMEQDATTKRWTIDLNTQNHKIMREKQVDNLHQIYDSGLMDFLEETFAGATIILFGSYSKGEDTTRSDIDIAIVGRKDKVVELTKYENALERDINLQFYDSWKNIHKNLKTNICNGIVLVGGVEL